MENVDKVLGVYTNGTKTGIVVEMHQGTQLGDHYSESFHYKVIIDEMQKKYEILLEEIDGVLVDSDKKIWKKKC